MHQQEFLDCFTDYQGISKLLKNYDCQEILETAAALVNSEPEVLKNYPMENFDGKIGSTYGIILRELQKNITQYDWMFTRLEDDVSRMVFSNLIGYHMFPDETFLKAACEAGYLQGFEKDFANCEVFEGGRTGLLDVKKHIRDNFPKFAMSIRHLAGELWEIPRLIDIICPGYHFFLRVHNFGADEKTVLYAIPLEQKRRDVSKTVKRIVTMPMDEGWHDAQLVKDCGVVPYLLYKNHSCEVSMVGAKQGDYPNLKYVSGLKMDFLPDGTLRSKVEYLCKEAGKIDAFILYGAYEEYEQLVDIYKMMNPQGKIYLASDANSHWMDQIQWTGPAFCRFLEQCDVIGVSDHIMQEYLNEKWPWVIECIPNGFYNFTGTDMTFSYEKKGNIILTVGRLGTKQKATHVLLEAFASIADQISDWKLHLAGTIEEEWKADYLNRFWEHYPSLRERICFLGQISDREALYQEYLSAKIFALPSTIEGGCPNVIAEALVAGNAIAITKIDGYRDAIGNGSCGLAAECGDVEGFANILLQLCQNEDLSKICRQAYEYAGKNFDMERIVDRLYYLLFGEE